MTLIFAELVQVKRRVAELEGLLFGVGSSPRRVRSPGSNDRFRAGKRLWSPEDDALLCKCYPHEATTALAATLRRSISATYLRAMKLGLAKTDEYLASPAACRLRRGDDVGAPFRFAKGHVPANKGLRRPG